MSGSRDSRQSLDLVLEQIGVHLFGSVGAVWVLDTRSKLFKCFGFWSSSPAQYPEFEEYTRDLTLACGEGLPGETWKRKKAGVD